MENLTNFGANASMVTIVLTLLISITLLYFARTPAHALLQALGNGLYQGFIFLSRAFSQLAHKLNLRNREVLLAVAKADSERRIEREHARVQSYIERDLAGYPEMQRRITEIVEKLEVSYQDSTDNPPLPPAWGDIVKTMADLPSHGDPAIAKILKAIKASVEEAHKETLKTYQANNAKRHKVLAQMQPDWRELKKNTSEIGTDLTALDERAHQLDKQMQHYEELMLGEDKTLRSLASSSLTQFFIAGIVLGIALLGGLINFQLIALPMSEMVSGSSYMGGFKTSDVAALVIILIEVAMGVFVLESLRITRLFPIIGSLDDRMRRRMLVVSLLILVMLAGVEASLAYMRDSLALNREAMALTITGSVAAAPAEFRWITSVGQMILGFILPFALAFIAIPLESFIHSLRTVIGLVFSSTLHLLAIVSRFIGMAARQSGMLLTHAYDILIMLPLRIEEAIRERAAKQPVSDDNTNDKETNTKSFKAKSNKPKNSKQDQANTDDTDGLAASA